MKRNFFTYLSISILLLSSFAAQSSLMQTTTDQHTGRQRENQRKNKTNDSKLSQQLRTYQALELQKIMDILDSFFNLVTQKQQHNPNPQQYNNLVNNTSKLYAMQRSRLDNIQDENFKQKPEAELADHSTRINLLTAIQNDMNTPEFWPYQRIIVNMLKHEHKEQRKSPIEKINKMLQQSTYDRTNNMLSRIMIIKKDYPMQKEAIEPLEADIIKLQSEREPNQTQLEEFEQRLKQTEQDIFQTRHEAKIDSTRFNEWGGLSTFKIPSFMTPL